MKRTISSGYKLRNEFIEFGRDYFSENASVFLLDNGGYLVYDG